MSEINLPNLKAKLTFLKSLYIVLFLASLIMIVLHSPAILFAGALGSAVLLRMFVCTPLQEKYNLALVENAQRQRNDEHQAILKKIDDKLESK